MSDFDGLWVKSSYSNTDGGNCIEWRPSAAAVTGVVPVRDSKSPEGPSLAVSRAAWAGLVEYAKTATI
ncbi:DUF397 domain-containing protein [Streptomyces sp. CFMR 7]|uniref:DUF397 domain-containing protein n=1 Tax=Streptomyces sp. CFMR 7 TaxID=1649184 RepID=UPI0011A0D95F|nr:DUF397 domain-containing protein [Streptomyces sp. CFMR 7]